MINWIIVRLDDVIYSLSMSWEQLALCADSYCQIVEQKVMNSYGGDCISLCTIIVCLEA